MYLDNIRRLDALTLDELEGILDEHTRKPVPVNQYTSFSWSASRHQMFARCRRQYYLNYYAPRRVQSRANHPVISSIWWLKQARTLPMWIGSVLHQVAQEAVLVHYYEGTPPQDDLHTRALALYREGLQASQRGTKPDGGWVILQEHIYPSDEAAVDWEEAEARVPLLVETLFDSEAYQAILSLPPEAILEADEPFQHMMFDGMRVFAIPDVLLLADDVYHIIDWKTGDVQHEGIRMQAGVYALYAHIKYEAQPAAIQVSIANLAEGGATVTPPGGTPSLEEAMAFVRESVAAMLGSLDSVEYNTVAIANYPMTDDLSVCRGCNFKRACWRHDMDWDD